MIEHNRSNKFFKLGEHYICDLSGCDRELLFNSERARALFTQAIRKSGLTIVGEGFYPFSPHGFTCFLLLAESHASLHAWPEYGYCAIDVFTCNLNFDGRPLINMLKDLFGSQHASIQRLHRRTLVERQALKEVMR